MRHLEHSERCHPRMSSHNGWDRRDQQQQMGKTELLGFRLRRWPAEWNSCFQYSHTNLFGNEMYASNLLSCRETHKTKQTSPYVSIPVSQCPSQVLPVDCAEKFSFIPFCWRITKRLLSGEKVTGWLEEHTKIYTADIFQLRQCSHRFTECCFNCMHGIQHFQVSLANCSHSRTSLWCVGLTNTFGSVFCDTYPVLMKDQANLSRLILSRHICSVFCTFLLLFFKQNSRTFYCLKELLMKVLCVLVILLKLVSLVSFTAAILKIHFPEYRYFLAVPFVDSFIRPKIRDCNLIYIQYLVNPIC